MMNQGYYVKGYYLHAGTFFSRMIILVLSYLLTTSDFHACLSYMIIKYQIAEIMSYASPQLIQCLVQGFTQRRQVKYNFLPGG